MKPKKAVAYHPAEDGHTVMVVYDDGTTGEQKFTCQAEMRKFLERDIARIVAEQGHH